MIESFSLDGPIAARFKHLEAEVKALKSENMTQRATIGTLIEQRNAAEERARLLKGERDSSSMPKGSGPFACDWSKLYKALDGCEVGRGYIEAAADEIVKLRAENASQLKAIQCAEARLEANHAAAEGRPYVTVTSQSTDAILRLRTDLYAARAELAACKAIADGQVILYDKGMTTAGAVHALRDRLKAAQAKLAGVAAAVGW